MAAASSMFFQIAFALLVVALVFHHEVESQLPGGLGNAVGGLTGGAGGLTDGSSGGQSNGLLSQLITALLGDNSNNPSSTLISQLADQLFGQPSGSPCCQCCNGTFGVNAVCATVGRCPPGGIVLCTAQPCQAGQACRLLDAGNLLCVGI